MKDPFSFAVIIVTATLTLQSPYLYHSSSFPSAALGVNYRIIKQKGGGGGGGRAKVDSPSLYCTTFF